jgi:sulfite reductase alpha subunit-like flavoprotein
MTLTLHFLARRAGAVLDVWVRAGTITLPADADTPMVMVGPGTGVAPFRNFIYERAAAEKQGSLLRVPGLHVSP